MKLLIIALKGAACELVANACELASSVFDTVGARMLNRSDELLFEYRAAGGTFDGDDDEEVLR